MLVLTCFAVALVASLALTPVSKIVGRRIGALDRPGELKVHNGVVPRFGGAAIWAAMALAVGMVGAAATEERALLWVILGGGTLVALVGALDDVIGLAPRVRLGAGLVITFSTAAAALSIQGHGHIAVLGGAALLALWLAANANAMNMLDGLDGLAAGVAAIAAVGLGLVGLLAGNQACAIVEFGLAGACLGFLRYNFRPASTFMGDVGSLFIGFVLGSALLLLSRPTGQGGIDPSAVAAGIVAAGVPMGDMFLAMARRMVNGRPVLQGDRSHSYDQLRDRYGLAVEGTCLTFYTAALLFGVLALGISRLDGPLALGALALWTVATCAVLVQQGFVQRENAST